MDADRANRWLSLTANIGVIVGLVLLLVELDQNNDLVRAQIHQARSDAFVQRQVELADSEFLEPIVTKYWTHSDSSSDVTYVLSQFEEAELAKLSIWLGSIHQDYDNLFYQYEQGYLDEEFYQYRVESSIRRLAPYWVALDIFESGGRRPSFDAEINRIMSAD